MTVYTLESDEFLFLHAIFQSPFAWGVQADFENEAAEHAAMEAAFEQLQNKGYVALKEDQLYVQPDLWELLDICTAPDHVLTFTYANAQDEEDLRFLYRREQTLVQDRVLPSQAQELQRVETLLDLARELKEQMQLAEQPQTQGEAQSIATATLESAQQSAAQGKAIVADKLLQAGVDATTATSLADVYVAPIANAVLTWIVPGDEGIATSMIFMESAEGLWEMHALDESQMQVTPVDAETAWQMLAAFCGAEAATIE